MLADRTAGFSFHSKDDPTPRLGSIGMGDDSIDISLSDNMDQLLSTHPNSLFLICGDFNCHHASWLDVRTSATHWD